MSDPFKKIRIAVIGARSSGKSYLLYDLIHAFSLLGYTPEELPLEYPHSSFGTYFYDTFNSETGGMRGTEEYACRPKNHYGAFLRGISFPHRLSVDFLNIPGEVFGMKGADRQEKYQGRIGKFFMLKNTIENKAKNLFMLSIWESPSNHIVKLIVPKTMDFGNYTSEKAELNVKHGNYLTWGQLLYDLKDGQYREIKRKSIKGNYIFRHITEINIDSLLSSIEDCWPKLTRNKENMDIDDFRADKVLKYLYPLAYCQLATDMIICDPLTDDDNVGVLAEAVSRFTDFKQSKTPNVYLAFRGSDGVMNPDIREYQQIMRNKKSRIGLKERNIVYTIFLNSIYDYLQGNKTKRIVIQPDHLRHMQISMGNNLANSFWLLLNHSTKSNRLKRFLFRRASVEELCIKTNGILPPHVYFTATPIDSRFCLYNNDPNDMTRFHYQDAQCQRSFTREVLSDPSKHMCFGSLQLLIDILKQNGVIMLSLLGTKKSKMMKYSQSRL